MSTRSGRAAEDFVADKLKKRGLKILDKNWRTRFCEIDIVACTKTNIYFVEVKFRASENQGRGLEYITPKKQKQMLFAAKNWVAQNDWSGDYCLSAAEVSLDKNGNLVLSNFVQDVV